MKIIILIEVILVMITGVLVTLVKYFEGGLEAVIHMANGVESSSLVIYVLGISIGISITTRLVRQKHFEKFKACQNKLQFVEKVFDGVGSGLLGLYRLISGITITVPFIWFFTAYDSFEWPKASIMLLTGVFFLIGGIIIALLDEYSKNS